MSGNVTDAKKKGRRMDFRSLRFKLTAAFIVFSFLTLGLLWIMQTAFLEAFYERSMEKKARSVLSMLSTMYSTTENLEADVFFGTLGDSARDNDIYLYVENEDQSAGLASTELAEGGRDFAGVSKMLRDVRRMLDQGDSDTVSYIDGKGPAGKQLVTGARVESPYRDTIFILAVVPLVPMGPTVEILSEQLFLVTIVALAFGGIAALVYGKRLAKPILDMNKKAEALGKGGYIDNFDETSGASEVRALAVTLNNTARELAKADSLQKDLLANVSHDLRTPLTMIRSYAELIRDISGEDPERRNEHLGVIIDETDRLSRLVGDILLLSKMQSGTLEMKHAPVDIERAAESVLSVYRVLEEQDGFSFRLVTLPDAKPIVMGDEGKLEQVFSNLISNAVHYSENDKRIEVKFEVSAPGRLRCSVTDHGMGIAKEDLDGVWNRYQRASRQGARAKEGTGLGLSIAKEILERHNADYGVSSQPGKGSCFWFVLSYEDRKDLPC